jgi:hypothetical protein
MHYVKHFDIDGVATRQAACIELHGKPNAATEGCVGVLGIDVDSPKREVYKCVAVNGNIYTWELLSVSALVETNSVVKYGAVGDGSADDTAAFKAALATERVVSVPGGIYKLSDGLVVRENCMLELAQDAVLEFTQTSGNAITLLRLANIKGNHATVNVPYTFSGNVINCDTGDDEAHLGSSNLAEANATAVPPFKKWSPQWKMSRYVTDINICKPKADGEHNSADGTSSGTAVYVHCNADDFVSYMWGVSMSGIRIAGAFNYGIRAYNIGAHVESWNHDMRIEAVIEACKVGVSLENCYYARLEVSVQAKSAANGAAYAVHGIELKDSRGVDLSGSRVWDWNEINSLWASGNEYQHLALYGECRGLILDDFVYYESSTPLRELIYTNKSSNFEQMTILQEPITKWFKPKNGEPIFSDGFNEKKLITQDHLDAHFDTDVVKNFTDVLATATDESGAVLDGKGYAGGFLTGTGELSVSGSAEVYYRTTGFIPCAKGQTMYVEGMSYVSYDGSCTLCMYDAQKKFISTVSAANLVKGSYWYAAYSATANGFTVTPQAVVGNENVAYIRFTVLKSQMGEYPMIAVDEEIKYTVEGFLADSVKVKVENVMGLNPDGSFDASGFVKSVNGNTPDKNGNVEVDLPEVEQPDWVATKTESGGNEVVISEQTLSSGLWSKRQMDLVAGITYDVYINGVVYPCKAYNEDGGIILGNNTALTMNDLPFCIYWAGGTATSGFFYKNSALSYPIKLKVTDHKEVVYNKMPEGYLPDSVTLFCVNISAGNDYSCSTPVSTLEAVLGTDRLIAAKITTDTGVLFAQLCSYETSADNSYGRIVMFALGALTFTLTPTSSGSYEVTVSGD